VTRKHFQALADTLRHARPLWPHEDFGRFSDAEAQTAVDQWTRDVRAVADVCAGQNGRFDRRRFYAACGLDR
jgi:hypothetical protein